MFRCRSFPGQYLFLTREQGEDRLYQVAFTKFWCNAFAGGDRSRLLRGRATSVRGRQKCRYRVAHSPAMRMHNRFAGGDVQRFLRRAQVRVLPQPSGCVAQLAEQDRCLQFPGEY